MKKILSVLSLTIFALVLPLQVHAACTVATPCMSLAWENPSMAPTLTLSTAGVETSGPGTAAVYRCIGAASVCSDGSLLSSLCIKGTCISGSPWSILSNTIAQSSSDGAYLDPAISYGETVNYAVSDTWSGSQGGAASAYSAIFQLAISTAPTAAPATPGSPTGVLVTSGF
jgi:hypothetical protein